MIFFTVTASGGESVHQVFAKAISGCGSSVGPAMLLLLLCGLTAGPVLSVWLVLPSLGGCKLY